MWPWSKIRELQRDLNTAKLLGGWAEEDRDWYKDRCQKLRDAQQPNPDAWRTVVIDEDLAKYYSPGKPEKTRRLRRRDGGASEGHARP
jgi:hypothetical protein